jgi:hypothetical protein
MLQLNNVEIGKIAGGDSVCKCFPNKDEAMVVVNEDACYFLCCGDYTSLGYFFEDKVEYCRD